MKIIKKAFAVMTLVALSNSIDMLAAMDDHRACKPSWMDDKSLYKNSWYTRDENGDTALHRATHAIDVSEVQKLLSTGRNPNIVDAAGHTPFHYACRNALREEPAIREQQLHIVQLLYWAHGDDPAFVIRHADPAVGEAILCADRAQAENSQKLHDMKLLPDALLYPFGGCVALAQLIKEYCGDVQSAPHSLKFRADPLPLFLASGAGRESDVLEALYTGVNINICAQQANTPLHNAAYLDQPKIVTILLKFGANTEAKNEDDQTPLQIAVDKGKAEIVELLLAHQKNNAAAAENHAKSDLDDFLSDYMVMLKAVKNSINRTASVKLRR